MDNVTFLTDYRQRHQQDALIDQRAALIYEGWYSDLPEDVRAKRREALAALDSQGINPLSGSAP